MDKEIVTLSKYRLSQSKENLEMKKKKRVCKIFIHTL